MCYVHDQYKESNRNFTMTFHTDNSDNSDKGDLTRKLAFDFWTSDGTYIKFKDLENLPYITDINRITVHNDDQNPPNAVKACSLHNKKPRKNEFGFPEEGDHRVKFFCYQGPKDIEVTTPNVEKIVLQAAQSTQDAKCTWK